MSYSVVDRLRRNVLSDALSTAAHGGAAGADLELEYEPLVGPSVWLKIPNRDPRKVGALQRFDRKQLEKLSARVLEAQQKLERLEKDENEKKLAAARAEAARQAEAKRKQEQGRIAQFKKPGARVYYNTYVGSAGERRVYGTIISFAQAKALGAASTHSQERDTMTYAIMDGTGQATPLSLTCGNLFLA